MYGERARDYGQLATKRRPPVTLDSHIPGGTLEPMADKKIDKNMSVEELAQMSQREFTAVRGEMREGFKAVEERFESVDSRFNAVMNRMDAGFSSIEQKIGALGEDFRHWKHDVLELQGRVERIEKHLKLDV